MFAISTNTPPGSGPVKGRLGQGVAKLGRKGHGRSSKLVSDGEGRANTIVKSALGKRQHSSVVGKQLEHLGRGNIAL